MIFNPIRYVKGDDGFPLYTRVGGPAPSSYPYTFDIVFDRPIKGFLFFGVTSTDLVLGGAFFPHTTVYAFTGYKGLSGDPDTTLTPGLSKITSVSDDKKIVTLLLNTAAGKDRFDAKEVLYYYIGIPADS